MARIGVVVPPNLPGTRVLAYAGSHSTGINGGGRDAQRRTVATFCPDPDDVEVRCMLTFPVRIGAYVVGADHPGRSRTDVMKLTGARRLRRPANGGGWG